MIFDQVCKAADRTRLDHPGFEMMVSLLRRASLFDLRALPSKIDEFDPSEDHPEFKANTTPHRAPFPIVAIERPNWMSIRVSEGYGESSTLDDNGIFHETLLESYAFEELNVRAVGDGLQVEVQMTTEVDLDEFGEELSRSGGPVILARIDNPRDGLLEVDTLLEGRPDPNLERYYREETMRAQFALCLAHIMSPNNWIVKAATKSAIQPRKGNIKRSLQRPRYLAVTRSELPRYLRGEKGDIKQHLEAGHSRRGHFRRLDEERITWVRPCWVGPKTGEVGGERYEVQVDI